MPIIDGPGEFEEGDQLPGVVCRECSAPIAIGQDPGPLPERFLATCQKCGYQGRYDKADVETLTVYRGGLENTRSAGGVESPQTERRDD